MFLHSSCRLFWKGRNLHVPAEHVAPSLTCHHSSKSPNTQSTITRKQWYNSKNGVSPLYFGSLLITRFWVCQAFLLLQGSARTELNVRSFDLKTQTLIMKLMQQTCTLWGLEKQKKHWLGCLFEVDGIFWNANVENTGVSSDGYCAPAALSICLQLTSK